MITRMTYTRERLVGGIPHVTVRIETNDARGTQNIEFPKASWKTDVASWDARTLAEVANNQAIGSDIPLAILQTPATDPKTIAERAAATAEALVLHLDRLHKAGMTSVTPDLAAAIIDANSKRAAAKTA